ncbi:hypothetical protein PoB_004550000 [Plakobranchus ocellatus]|uniref:Uncharacterized protein n=1 Tax=Plakobranchus ocellatus TaxID=259542 RepID=A0AAV4BHL4_9GAST|nr:hypothetical protein PoB_004550000 [Plakobranchus ocellatus]
MKRFPQTEHQPDSVMIASSQDIKQNMGGSFVFFAFCLPLSTGFGLVLVKPVHNEMISDCQALRQPRELVARGEARTRDRRISADLRAGSLTIDTNAFSLLELKFSSLLSPLAERE